MANPSCPRPQSPIFCSTFHSAVNATRLGAGTAGSHFAYYTVVGVESAGANIEALNLTQMLLKDCPLCSSADDYLRHPRNGALPDGSVLQNSFDAALLYPPCPFSWVRLSVYSLASTNRKALFDLSIAGPLAGFVVTLPLLIWGLAHSTVVPLPAQPGMLNPDALNLTTVLVALQQAGARHSVDR